jgi:hypothetical protein
MTPDRNTIERHLLRTFLADFNHPTDERINVTGAWRPARAAQLATDAIIDLFLQPDRPITHTAIPEPAIDRITHRQRLTADIRAAITSTYPDPDIREEHAQRHLRDLHHSRIRRAHANGTRPLQPHTLADLTVAELEQLLTNILEETNR